MSLKKSIARNIARQNDNLLKQYSGQLVPNWQTFLRNDKDLLAMMARNGITAQDLADARKEGWDSAYKQTAPVVMKICYSAFSSVLVDEFGFSPDDCFRVVQMADHKIALSIDPEELNAEMEEKAKIRFQSSEGVDRVVQI